MSQPEEVATSAPAEVPAAPAAPVLLGGSEFASAFPSTWGAWGTSYPATIPSSEYSVSGFPAYSIPSPSPFFPGSTSAVPAPYPYSFPTSTTTTLPAPTEGATFSTPYQFGAPTFTSSSPYVYPPYNYGLSSPAQPYTTTLPYGVPPPSPAYGDLAAQAPIEESGEGAPEIASARKAPAVAGGERIVPVYQVSTLDERIRSLPAKIGAAFQEKEEGYEPPEKWAIPMIATCVKNPGVCLPAYFLPCCFLFGQRRKLLQNDGDNYICCAGACGTFSRGLSLLFPGQFGAAVESCFVCCANDGNRDIIQETYDIDDHASDMVIMFTCGIGKQCVRYVPCVAPLCCGGMVDCTPVTACQLAQQDYELRHRNFPYVQQKTAAPAPVAAPEAESME